MRVAVMYQFLHLRSRPLQTLFLGLIGLTFYAYYRTYYDVPQFALPRNVSHSTYRETLSHRSNHSVDARPASLLKNATFEILPSGSSNVSYASGSVTTSPISSGSQTSSPASASTSRESKKTDERRLVSARIDVVPNNTKSTASTRNDCTAHAIYEAGHVVPIPDKCPNFGRDMDLVIMIMSAPTHLKARTAIRQTWGHFGQRSDVGVLFMLGATADPKVEAVLKKEQKIYNDMIRGKFLDSYSNLTLKTISTLEWVDNYCSKAKFVLKTDDDMFINVPCLQSFVNRHAKDRNTIFGRLAKNWKPIRNKKSKYYVSQEQFERTVFPDFTTGPAYLLSTDIVRKLYEAALNQTYLKLEDVFITGIVADKLGIKRTHANEFLNKKISYNACNVQRSISIHMVKYSEQFDLWKKLLDGKSKCKR